MIWKLIRSTSRYWKLENGPRWIMLSTNWTYWFLTISDTAVVNHSKDRNELVEHISNTYWL